MNDSEIVKLLIRKDNRITALEEENRELRSPTSSWADLNTIAYDEWKEHGGLSNFEAWYVNWLEDNFYPPSKRK